MKCAWLDARLKAVKPRHHSKFVAERISPAMARLRPSWVVGRRRHLHQGNDSENRAQQVEGNATTAASPRKRTTNQAPDGEGVGFQMHLPAGLQRADGRRWGAEIADANSGNNPTNVQSARALHKNRCAAFHPPLRDPEPDLFRTYRPVGFAIIAHDSVVHVIHFRYAYVFPPGSRPRSEQTPRFAAAINSSMALAAGALNFSCAPASAARMAGRRGTRHGTAASIQDAPRRQTQPVARPTVFSPQISFSRNATQNGGRSLLMAAPPRIIASVPTRVNWCTRQLPEMNARSCTTAWPAQQSAVRQ